MGVVVVAVTVVDAVEEGGVVEVAAVVAGAVEEEGVVGSFIHDTELWSVYHHCRKRCLLAYLFFSSSMVADGFYEIAIN